MLYLFFSIFLYLVGTDIVQELSRDNFVKLLKSQQETSSGSKAVSSNWNAVKEINVANSNKNKKKVMK